MKIPLLRGRIFEATDSSKSPLVAIVSAATATRLWPGQDPIGKRLHLSLSEDGEWHTVVGVVGTARYREIDSPRFDRIRSATPGGHRRSAFMRADQRESAERGFGDRGRDLRVRQRLVGRRSHHDGRHRPADAGPWRFNMLVFGLFGGVALGLAAVGPVRAGGLRRGAADPRDRPADRARRRAAATSCG